MENSDIPQPINPVTRGMVEVEKEEFFSTIGQLDVHVSSRPDFTYWRLKGLRTIGISIPGYISVYGLKKRWFMLPEYRKQEGGPK